MDLEVVARAQDGDEEAFAGVAVGVGNRLLGIKDPLLADRVADSVTFHDMTQSESLVFGTDFGIVTDAETGTDAGLDARLDHGSVDLITRR